LEKSKYLDEWAQSILADPITKESCLSDHFDVVQGVLDARVFLKNSFGYSEWKEGQKHFESWEEKEEQFENVEEHLENIEYDRPVYEYFRMTGDIADIGGMTGEVREFLQDDVNFISIDPFIEVPHLIQPIKTQAYKCFSDSLNFICGFAEFLPFKTASFDWVHMRSMLDHVQVPDLALIETKRVLKPGGALLVGLYVEGGKSGRHSFLDILKHYVKDILALIGISYFKDFHTWHPTYLNLKKLLTDNGFYIEDEFWQPYWKDKVVYIKAIKE
jgi:SAM-dependent methyltransferase